MSLIPVIKVRNCQKKESAQREGGGAVTLVFESQQTNCIGIVRGDTWFKRRDGRSPLKTKFWRVQYYHRYTNG